MDQSYIRSYAMLYADLFYSTYGLTVVQGLMLYKVFQHMQSHNYIRLCTV